MPGADLLKAPNITIFAQIPQLEMCDTMWGDCKSLAVCLIVEDFGGHRVRAARCEKHLLAEWPHLSCNAPEDQ